MNRESKSNAGISLLKIVQVIWTIQLILVSLIVLLHPLFSIVKIIVPLFALSFVYSTLGIISNRKRAWIASISLLTLYWLIMGWQAIVSFFLNNYLFFTNHPLYIDSPATILVVYAGAIFGILPAGILTLLYIFNYKQIRTNWGQPLSSNVR
jgi:hypothetical protein